MTTYINLLPHREERRKRARQHFGILAGATVLAGLAIVAVVHTYFAGKQQTQDDRNKFLTAEIAKIDKEIAEIKKLQDEIESLLERKKVIERLQTDRAQTVHLLDELVKQMPEGVYLTKVNQRGLGVNLGGYAQSNARVSTLMRNIDASPWLQSPNLIEIKASTLSKQRVSEFTMSMSVKRAAPPKDETAKPPAKAAAGKKR